jgi:hypothetical protein
MIYSTGNKSLIAIPAQARGAEDEMQQLYNRALGATRCLPGLWHANRAKQAIKQANSSTLEYRKSREYCASSPIAVAIAAILQRRRSA